MTAEAREPAVENLRLGLMGDSIASGLGVRSDRYIEIVARALGATLLDFSESGSTIRGSWRRYTDAGSPALDIMVIAHGITEPLLRPRPASLRFVPSRWRRLGWMDPRPYYSTRLVRRLLERAESAIRWRLKNSLIMIGGPHVLEPRDSYVEAMQAAAASLRRKGCRVLILEPTSIDERFFPGTNSRQQSYWSALESTPGLERIMTRGALVTWDDYFADHFHPNGLGHAKLAEAILKAL